MPSLTLSATYDSPDVREAFEVQDEEAKMITAPNPGTHGPPGDRVPDPLTAAAQKGY